MIPGSCLQSLDLHFILQEGQGLTEERHYASDDIKKRLEELELSWQALIAASAEKKDRLQDAYRVSLMCFITDEVYYINYDCIT